MPVNGTSLFLLLFFAESVVTIWMLKTSNSTTETAMQTFLTVFILLGLIIWASKDKRDKPDKNKKTSINQHKTKPSSDDYYSILEVSKSATNDEIKKSYKRLVKKYHPDVNPDKNDASERFKELQEAYDTLKDSQKRANYDKILEASAEKEYEEETVILSAGSIQELRGLIAINLGISSRVIQLTQNGYVFINRLYAFRWRAAKRDNAIYHPRMKIRWEYITETYFEYYRPKIVKPVDRNIAELETIVLTAPDIDSLRVLIGMCFSRGPENVVMADNGSVFIDDEYAWKWRYSGDDYYEYYIPSGEDFDVWFARFEQDDNIY